MPAIQTTAARLTSKSPGVIRPNKLTVAFNEMKLVCPDAIKLYANCVSTHHNNSTLDKNCCAEEFAVVKECFRSVLKK
jgi:hypothetical protein